MGKNSVSSGKDERQTMLDRGYDALKDRQWQQAQEIFRQLLSEDPHCGLSLLGLAMAERELETREALADQWQLLSRDPAFQKALEPAEPDFLQWLQGEMPWVEEDDSDAWTPGLEAPDLSGLSRGRKLLLCFAAIQLVLYCLVYFFFWRSEPTDRGGWSILLGNLIFTTLICGGPVILGPLYGNAIVECGRFPRLLKVLNLISSILGLGVAAIMIPACYTAMEKTAVPLRSDLYFFLAFIVSFLLHLLALIFPWILGRVED